jgi:hypothetical protein
LGLIAEVHHEVIHACILMISNNAVVRDLTTALKVSAKGVPERMAAMQNDGKEKEIVALHSEVAHARSAALASQLCSTMRVVLEVVCGLQYSRVYSGHHCPPASVARVAKDQINKLHYSGRQVASQPGDMSCARASPNALCVSETVHKLSLQGP